MINLLSSSIFFDEIDLEKDSEKIDSIISKLPKPMVFTNGVFDILHTGHIRYLRHAKKIGKDKEHLKINIKTKSNTIGGIGFGLGNRFDHLIKGKAFDVCFSLAENQWNGEKKIQLILKDIREGRKS